jgi:hypothetical protein
MSDDNENDDLDMFITYSFDFKFIRVIGNMFVPSEMGICASLVRAEATTDEEVEFAFTKWKYWFDNVVTKTICFDRQNTSALDILLDEHGINQTANMFLMAPEDPSDEILGALFQAKMNALALGAVVVASLDIRSDNLHGLSFTLTGDHSTYLPATINDWLGGVSWWEQPWWRRNDASSIDVSYGSAEDLGQVPGWAYSLDFLDRSQKAKLAAGQKVPRSTFQPTIIPGGKDDDPNGV